MPPSRLHGLPGYSPIRGFCGRFSLHRSVSRLPCRGTHRRAHGQRGGSTYSKFGGTHTMRRLGAGLVGAVVLAGSLLTVAAAQDTKKDKAKDAPKDAKEITGKITKVDADKMTFSIK